MKHLKNFLIANKWILIAIAIVTVAFSYFVVFADGNFMFLGDILDQQLKMYMNGWQRIREGTLPFWDWSNFLGANYFGSNTFYFIGSPFFWLAMLLPKIEWILPYFLFANYLKSLLCTVFTFKWIKKVTKDEMSAFVCSMIITFCGFTLYNYSNNHIFDAVLFLPLILYYVECFLKNNKFLMLSISIGILGIVNYYFLYIFTPFLFLYVLVRYFILNKFNLKDTLIKALKFSGIYLIGIGICCITLIPSALVLTNNPRSSELLINLNTIGKHNLFRLLTGFINPINNWRENANYFINTLANPGVGWSGGMMIYSLMITPFSLAILFFTKLTKEKIGIIILYLMYFIFSLFPFFYILFNQNFETRWMVNIVLLNTFMVGYIISIRNDISRKSYIYSASSVIAFVIIAFAITTIFKLSPEIWGYKILLRNCVIVSLITLIYCIIFYLKKEKILLIALPCILLFEIGFSYYNLFKNDGWYLGPMTEKEMEEYDLWSGKNVIDYIKDKDNGFYRIDVGAQKFISINDPILNNYRSFNTYHSVYNYNLTDFIAGRFGGKNSWVFSAVKGKDQLKNQLASKYWFTFANAIKKDLVKLNTNYNLTYFDNPPFGYEKIETVDGIDIYQNKYFVPLMYIQNKTLDLKTYLSMSLFEQDKLLKEYVIVDDTDQHLINYSNNLLLIDEIVDNSIVHITDDMKGNILYIIFNDNNFMKVNYAFYDDTGNEILNTANQNVSSYLEIAIPDNADTFKMQGLSAYTVYVESLESYEKWYSDIKNRFVEDIEVFSNKVFAKANMEEDGYIVTSIPYDSGWKVKVNDESVKIENINNGFIGVPVVRGEYVIELTYIPPGLLIGTLMSAGALITLTIVYVINKNRIKS